MTPRPPRSTLFPYTTLFRSGSMPELQPAMIEMVPVGATVVTLQLRSFCIGRMQKLRNRSEEHTSELQSLTNLVCRLLLEKKKNINKKDRTAQIKHTNSM